MAWMIEINMKSHPQPILLLKCDGFPSYTEWKSRRHLISCQELTRSWKVDSVIINNSVTDKNISCFFVRILQLVTSNF